VTPTTGSGVTSDATTMDAERYLKDVAPHLAALPADERADLLEDLAQHLQEVAAEPGPPLVERLGSPEAYAAELLASAGVTARVQPGMPVLARAAAVLERIRHSWVGREAVHLAPVLRPAWWVARGYLAVSVLASLQGDGSAAFPLPELAQNGFVGLLAVIGAVALSVRLGQRPLPRSGRLLLVAGNVVLALYGLSLLDDAGASQIQYVDYSRAPTAADRGCLATVTGQPITNLYAYDAEGRLLDRVLLYDQDGQPLDNLCPELDARGRRLYTEYGRDANGAPVINAFPRRQATGLEPGRVPFPGQPEATVPVKPPAVVVPRLATSTTVTTAPG
jgi:hypothetical protein